MHTRLSEAAPSVRNAALANLVGSLEPDELDELARFANRIKRARSKE
jgi:hypothetical protein